MSNTYHCKSDVSFNQACHSIIALVTIVFGLTRTGTIFEVCGTILNFVCDLKTTVLDTADVLCIWHNSVYVCEPEMFR